MDRRQLFKVALGTGLAVGAQYLGPLDPAEAAAAKPLAFFDGTVTGDSFAGWRLLLATTGTAVRGTLFDPNSFSLEGVFNGYRVRGALNGHNRASMLINFFAKSDLQLATPLGTGMGHKQGSAFTGNFDLTDGGPTLLGAFNAPQVALSAKRAKRFTGKYFVFLQKPGGPALINAKAKVTANAFSLTEIEDERGPGFQVPTTMQGRWGVTAGGVLWATSLLPDLTGFQQPLTTPSEIQTAQL